MPPFLRENAVIILGLTLPLLLMLALMLARNVQSSGPRPTHEVVFALHDYNYPIEITVKDERLHITTLPEKNDYHTPRAPVTIYHYNPATNTTRAYNIERTRVTKPTPYQIPADLAALRLDDNPQSPDGYYLTRINRRSGGFFSEIFFATYKPQIVLKNGNKTIPIPSLTESYGTEQFIGWVIPENE